MLEELLTNTTFSPVHIAIAIAVGLLCFWIGWKGRGSGARRREADLRRDVFDAKSSVPQLESTVRNRDQQIARLHSELQELNTRNADLLRAQDDKERELRGAQREVRNLTSELTAVKGGRGDSSNLIMDGFEDEAVTEREGESPLASKLRKTEALYEKLKEALIKRDERIEQLESGVDDGGARASVNGHEPAINGAAQDSTPTIWRSRSSLKASPAPSTICAPSFRTPATKRRCSKIWPRNAARPTGRSKSPRPKLRHELPELEREIEERQRTISDREASIKRLLNDLESTRANLKASQEEVDRLVTESESRVTELEQVGAADAHTRVQHQSA